MNHQYRYALIQTFKIIGIKSPIIVNSTQVKAMWFYKETKYQNRKLILLDFGDSGF